VALASVLGAALNRFLSAPMTGRREGVEDRRPAVRALVRFWIDRSSWTTTGQSGGWAPASG
jgi:hypothetical protein